MEKDEFAVLAAATEAACRGQRKGCYQGGGRGGDGPLAVVGKG